MATEPRTSWPDPEENGWIVEHVTFDSGEADYPDGRTKPTVVVTMYARDVDGLDRKRSLRMFLTDDLADQAAKVLPMAARDARRGMKEDEAGRG